MVTIPDRRKNPKRERIGKGNWVTEEHEVFGGRVKVIRTPQSGNVYQMRVWIHEGQRYIRKSLRTEYLPEALQKAEDFYLDIRSKQKSGEPVFEFTAGELVLKYLEFKETQAKIGGEITVARWVTIRSQMNHYLAFVGEKNKIGSIHPSKFDEYAIFRRSYAPEVRELTIINEASTIKTFYHWCADRGFLDTKIIPKMTIIKKKGDAEEKISRDALSPDEWRKIYHHMQGWNKNTVDPLEKEQKEFVRDFALLLANTGLRFGEARKLKWMDVLVRVCNPKTGDCDVTIELKEGKTGKRTIIGRRGDVLQRIQKLSKHTKSSDFIFVDNATGDPIKREVYYQHWNKMIDDIGFDRRAKQYVYYALRHMYATFRLYNGVDVYTLAKNMGTSVSNIEKHYGHVEMEKMREMLVRGFDAESMRYLGDMDEHLKTNEARPGLFRGSLRTRRVTLRGR